MPNLKEEISNFSLVLPIKESCIAPPGVRSNEDTDPAPPEKRTWTPMTWVMYWASDIITVSGWQKAASMIQLGLDWRNSLGVTVLGSCLLAGAVVANGKIGVKLRVPFPVVIRGSHGYWLAYFPIVSRVIIAFLWFGVQSWNGGTAMSLCIGAIWPSFKKIPNHLPTSAGFTTVQMVSYLLYSIVQFPFLFIHPTKLKWVFMVKAILCPIVALGTMAWCVKQAGGASALSSAQPTASGTEFTSAWLLSLTSLIGGYSTLALNVPDFTRYASSNKAQMYQAPILPFMYLVTALFGIISASCTPAFANGKVLWSPLDITALWDSRAAVFFCSAIWLLAQISCNVSANSISAANDLATLLPKYINIRRGQIITAIIGGWAMVPYKVLSSGKVFLSAISAYAIVLGPFAGIMTSDFYFVKRQKYDVPGLYDPRGRYRYAAGFNWRAAVTLVCTIGPNLPGMINAIQPAIAIGGVSWIYSVSWIFGYFVSIIIYTTLNLVFPHRSTLVARTISAGEYLAAKAEGRAVGSATPSGEYDAEKEGGAESDKELGAIAYEVPVTPRN